MEIFWFHINAEMLHYTVNGFLKYLEVVPTMHTEHYKHKWNAILSVVSGVKKKGSCSSVLCLHAYIVSFEKVAILQDYKTDNFFEHHSTDTNMRINNAQNSHMYVPTARGEPLCQLSRHVTKETKGMSYVNRKWPKVQTTFGLWQPENREDHHDPCLSIHIPHESSEFISNLWRLFILAYYWLQNNNTNLTLHSSTGEQKTVLNSVTQLHFSQQMSFIYTTTSNDLQTKM